MSAKVEKLTIALVEAKKSISALKAEKKALKAKCIEELKAAKSRTRPATKKAAKPAKKTTAVKASTKKAPPAKKAKTPPLKKAAPVPELVEAELIEEIVPESDLFSFDE